MATYHLQGGGGVKDGETLGARGGKMRRQVELRQNITAADVLRTVVTAVLRRRSCLPPRYRLKTEDIAL